MICESSIDFSISVNCLILVLAWKSKMRICQQKRLCVKILKMNVILNAIITLAGSNSNLSQIKSLNSWIGVVLEQ
jgi:uncharacterized membrane protein YkvI